MLSVKHSLNERLKLKHVFYTLLGYLHETLLLVGTTTACIRGFFTMSCQWIVSAWHRNLFLSTYTPPLRISVEKREHTFNDDTQRASWGLFLMGNAPNSSILLPGSWCDFLITSVPPQHHFVINNWHVQTLHFTNIGKTPFSFHLVLWYGLGTWIWQIRTGLLGFSKWAAQLLGLVSCSSLTSNIGKT